MDDADVERQEMLSDLELRNGDLEMDALDRDNNNTTETHDKNENHTTPASKKTSINKVVPAENSTDEFHISEKGRQSASCWIRFKVSTCTWCFYPHNVNFAISDTYTLTYSARWQKSNVALCSRSYDYCTVYRNLRPRSGQTRMPTLLLLQW